MRLFNEVFCAVCDDCCGDCSGDCSGDPTGGGDSISLIFTEFPLLFASFKQFAVEKAEFGVRGPITICRDSYSAVGDMLYMWGVNRLTNLSLSLSPSSSLQIKFNSNQLKFFELNIGKSYTSLRLTHTQ